MTGRDLIIYIKSNNLEDKPVFENNTILGFLTVGEAAAKMNVGVASVYTLISQGRLDAIRIPESVFGYLIPQDCKLKPGGTNEQKQDK